MSDSGLREYVKANQFSFPVYYDPPASVIEAYGLGTTPGTIIVAPDGRVLEDVRGAYRGTVKNVLEDLLAIRLPAWPESPAGL